MRSGCKPRAESKCCAARLFTKIALPWVWMLSVSAQTPTDALQKAKSLLDQGQSLALAGRLAEAEVPLSTAAALAPTDVPTLTLLAEVKGRMGDSKGALILFRRLATLQPNSDIAHLNLAIELSDDGDEKAALIEVEKAIRLNPGNARAHLNRARLLADVGRVVDSRAEFRNAARLDPQSAETHYFWGILEKANHNPGEAARLFAKVVAQRPDDSRAYFFLGQCLQATNRDEEAIAAWKRAIAIDPSSKEVAYALSQALRAKDPVAASDMLEKFKALQLREQATDQARNLGNQAYSAMQKQSWTTAIAALRQAIEICNECTLAADLHQRLGLAECHAGNLDEGEAELRFALSLKPDNRETVGALQWIQDQRRGISP